MGFESESIEAVQLGTQELTFKSAGPVPNSVPETRILDIPFLLRDKTHARAVLDGPIGQDLLKAFEAKRKKALDWGENGVRHLTNSKRAVKTPDDLKDLKMRTMENPMHVAACRGSRVATTFAIGAILPPKPVRWPSSTRSSRAWRSTVKSARPIGWPFSSVRWCPLR